MNRSNDNLLYESAETPHNKDGQYGEQRKGKTGVIFYAHFFLATGDGVSIELYEKEAESCYAYVVKIIPTVKITKF